SYQYNLWDLYLGNVGGSIGETCALAIVLGGFFLLLRKVASWRVMLGVALGAGLVSVLGSLFGVEKIPDPLFTFGSGGLLFGLVFMATDPVSGSSTNPGKWIMGFGVGALTVLLRSFSIFAGAVMFSILLMNTFTPLIDFLVKEYVQSKKVRSTK
ncbi:MAG TPA: RnfABCDGE type electron transport complex subunit D, partial [bacterium]|nr:RnfABCDGE type electron transport complex subunit D [bacterium]